MAIMTTVGIYRDDLDKLKTMKLVESAAQNTVLTYADLIHQILTGELVVA